MRFHPPSFVLGLGSAVVVMGAKQHLRPVFVELAALGVHLGRLGLALLERQREHAEDLWAEIGDRVRRRAEGPPAPAAGESNGASELRPERPS
jgi:hypothetical protein